MDIFLKTPVDWKKSPKLKQIEFITELSRQTSVVGEFDVVVVGGGAAGIGAAIGARKNGASVVLVERDGCLGGVITTGLMVNSMVQRTASFDEKNVIVKGIAQELCERLETEGSGRFKRGGFAGELESMKRNLDEVMIEYGVRVLYFAIATDVIKEDNCVRGIIIQTKGGRQAIKAGCVVDATGDADIAALAGARFQKGRETDGQMQPMTMMFRIGGIDKEELKEFLQKYHTCKEIFTKAIAVGDMEPINNAFGAMCFCDTRSNQAIVNFGHMPHLDGTNPWHLSFAMVEGRRQAHMTLEVLKKYFDGCENAYMIDTAVNVGVRETRRIIGETTLTVEDVLSAKKRDDGIAKGAFFVDIHDPDKGMGQYKNLHRVVPKGEHYDIPYGCLLPEEIDNLLVAGRCISVTHEALGSTRVIFQCIALGEAAGTAAALSIKKRVVPRTLNIKLLQTQLCKQRAVI